MVKRLVANGTRIKELRIDGSLEMPQKTLAGQCGISEWQLRRIETKNLAVALPVFDSVCGPKLVPDEQISARPVAVQNVPETILIPRHTTALLAPVAGAQALYDLAKRSMEIVPHILVDSAPAQMAMIEECLAMLKTISEREWSCGRPVEPDAHDIANFPEASRRGRLAELFVLLKGHDIRLVANTEIYYYPPGATPWLQGQTTCTHFVIGFAPPRGAYEEEGVTVPFDGGRGLVLPYNPMKLLQGSLSDWLGSEEVLGTE